MPRRSPPSSRSYLVRVPGVIEAGGALRDALGSLRNLHQLVRSMRVGPKGLERAVPDVHSACQPSIVAVESLRSLLATALPDGTSLEELSRFVSVRIADTATALVEASKQSMTAKNRLTLEQVLGRVVPELEAGQNLLDLLAEAAWAPAVPSPLVDMLSIGQGGGETDASANVQVRLEENLAHFEVALPPALTQRCLCILAVAFHARHGRGPVIQLRPQGQDYCLELNSTLVPGTTVSWPLEPLIEPSLAVAAAALRARDCQVTLSDHPRILLPHALLGRLDSHGPS